MRVLGSPNDKRNFQNDLKLPYIYLFTFLQYRDIPVYLLGNDGTKDSKTSLEVSYYQSPEDIVLLNLELSHE
jgi:hypothetical protein